MIEIKNLTVLNKEQKLISNLNATFKEGEFWAILGKNGTGKTTLLHTLAGLLDYRIGQITVNGIELRSLSSIQRAREIAVLSQLMETGLNCTVEQNIAYGRYAWNKLKNNNRSDEKLINAAINNMELEELRKKSIQEISGGELRKVEIATILAQNSQIMILDEPLNHLDISFRYKLMHLLKQLSDKKLIIIVTHDIQYVKAYCSHVMLLNKNGETSIGLTSDIMNINNINKMLDTNLPNNILL